MMDCAGNGSSPISLKKAGFASRLVGGVEW